MTARRSQASDPKSGRMQIADARDQRSVLMKHAIFKAAQFTIRLRYLRKSLMCALIIINLLPFISAQRFLVLLAQLPAFAVGLALFGAGTVQVANQILRIAREEAGVLVRNRGDFRLPPAQHVLRFAQIVRREETLKMPAIVGGIKRGSGCLRLLRIAAQRLRKNIEIVALHADSG